MTLDQIETFLKIVESGGLRAASLKLHKTQPTLSQAIKNLESNLGVVLFDRKSYRLKLTKEAEQLHMMALGIMAQVHEMKLAAKELSMGREAKLYLAIDSLCPLPFILKILNTFSNNCGGTKLEVDFEVLGGAEDKIINFNVDIAITPFITQHNQIYSELIGEVETTPVGSKRIFKNSKVNLNFLLSKPQIFVKDTARKIPATDFGGHPKSNKWIVSDHMIKRELILEGFGWGSLERTSIQKELKSKKLIELQIPGLPPRKIPMFLARSQKKALGPAAIELWNFIKQQMMQKAYDR